MKNLKALFIVVIGFLATIGHAAAAISNTTDAQFFSTPNPQGHVEFINLVDSAKSSINLEIFHLSVQEDIDALIRAHNRGINVRVILNRDITAPATTTSSDTSPAMTPPPQSAQQMHSQANAATFQQLKDVGVDVKLSSSKFSITHEKSMSIDQNKVMISTMNLTHLYKVTRDFGVILNDQNIIKEFDDVFEADWINADNNSAETPPLSVDQLVWSPTNSKQKILQLINSAQQSLELYTETIADKDILQALENKANNGVTVKVITPLCVSGFNPLFNIPALQALQSQKVNVKVMPHQNTEQTPYIHAKA